MKGRGERAEGEEGVTRPPSEDAREIETESRRNGETEKGRNIE